MEQLCKQLHLLGCSEREAQVYVSLALKGRASIVNLARSTRLPRSTVHSALEALISKKLISRQHSKSADVYAVLDPEAWNQLLERDQLEAQERLLKQKQITAVVTRELRALWRTERQQTPRLVFHQGQKEVEQMLFSRVSVWQDSVSSRDNVWWGYQDHELVRHYSSWITHHAKLMRKDEQVRLFSNESDTERRLKGKIQNRIIRLAPRGYEFSSTIWVIGDFVITLSCRETPHYASEVEDPLFASNQRMIFQMLWKASESREPGTK